MGGLIEKVAGDEGHHSRVAAVILAEVEDHGVCIRQKTHGCNYGRSADAWIHEGVELQVTNIARQNLHLFERAVVPLDLIAESRDLIWGWGPSLRDLERAEAHVEMP